MNACKLKTSKSNILMALGTGHWALILCCLFSVSVYANPDIRKITPPQLETTHLGARILCHRPMRRGTPEMRIEKHGHQMIAHNYGHGGSGWTLGPGSADYVNTLLIQSPDAKDLDKKTPITIIGAGALGLFTAYDLLEKGYTNLHIVAERFENLTSHNAGGLLAPVSMDNDPSLQKIIDGIGIKAYVFYESIAKHKHPHFKQGAVTVPTYFKNREASGLEPYVGKVMRPAKDVTLDFGNGTQRDMVAYDDGIFIDTSKMMDSLNAYLKKQGVVFEKKRIKDFSEIQTRYVINCSGLGAKDLNKDEAMVSVQGHLVMLKDQKPKDLMYMILVYFGEGTTPSGQSIKRSFYIFPKHMSGTKAHDVGVIGGTFIEGASLDTPNNEEFDRLITQAKDFYGLK